MFTPELAEVLKARAGEKYRPSNGTEGDIFRGLYCDQCKKDANHDCLILAKTLALGVHDERYPQEWQYMEDGQPTCTAFEVTD